MQSIQASDNESFDIWFLVYACAQIVMVMVNVIAMVAFAIELSTSIRQTRNCFGASQIDFNSNKNIE